MKKYLPILILFFVFSCTCLRGSCPQRATRSDQSSQGVYSNTFIEISMQGGGFYGGVNPVTENKSLIKSNGEILVSTKQLYTGDKIDTLFTSPGKVEELAEYIRDNGFFNMKDVYDCGESNQECQERKRKYPPAVPLQLDVTIGQTTKQVTVTVYEKGMVDYPDNLEAIVNRIKEVISRAEEQN